MAKILITGGVAGGATAAARTRRLNEDAEIILFERDEYISFANCGLPYYIGGVIEERDSLFVTTKEDFAKRYNIDIRNYSSVVSIDRKAKTIRISNSETGETYDETYDKLILSPGAEPVTPPIDGVNSDNIFTLRNIADTDNIKNFVDNTKPKSAVIAGGGFIGLEMAENLVHRGIEVTVIELASQVMTVMDPEMAEMIHEKLKENSINLELNNKITKFQKNGDKISISTFSGKIIDCDMVIMSVGVKPENKLAVESGLETGERGGIVVNEHMQTSDPDIFAVGDAVEIFDFITKERVMVPLAGPANKQARIAADNACNRNSTFKGTIGTSVVKLFNMVAASTGQTEKTLVKSKIPFRKSYTFSGAHASYYPGSEGIKIKLLFSEEDGKVLGAQMVGVIGVDKRIDVIATAIKGGLTVYDLEELELAYAPPFSSAKDPVNIAGFVAGNILKKDVETIYPEDISQFSKDNSIILDLRSKDEIKESGRIDNSICIPVDELRDRLDELDKSKTYILYCAIGLRGYIGWRILSQKGFKAKNLSGGFLYYKYSV